MAVACCGAALGVAAASPFDAQVTQQIERLNHPNPVTRAGAAEALGYLRAYSSALALTETLDDDPAPTVRREAALSLAWCGGRTQVPPLLNALGDEDWTVRQAAWVALTNLTGMEWPYDALSHAAKQAAQAARWREEWAAVPPGAAPQECLDLLEGASVEEFAAGCVVSASSTYKGPPGILTDGFIGGAYWQTKNVPFPQHCTVDLGRVRTVACVVVHQYGEGFCMTDYALETSDDNETYTEILRRQGKSPPRLVIAFAPHEARYIRITSYDSENRTYPTTFREIQVMPEPPPEPLPDWRIERGLRALGALGGAGAAETVAKVLAPYRLRDAGRSGASANPNSRSDGTPAGRLMVQAGIRALGRLREPKTLPGLLAFLEHPQWARYAADALGDFGGDEAVKALIAACPHYARGADYSDPKRVPGDDRPGLSPVDRMYETPFAIAYALARLPLSDENRAALRDIAPLLAANLPGDFDAAVLYEPEAHHQITAYLLEQAGLREAALDAVLHVFGVSREPPIEPFATMAKRRIADVPHAAAWLPALATTDDVPALLNLLAHDNGWVRINAAKALIFLDERPAVEPIARILAESQPEAAYGYYGVFRFYKGHINGGDQDAQDEYDDPSPRWREAYVRALGRLDAADHVPLLIKLLKNEQNVLDVRHAAALALDDLGTPQALNALEEAEGSHPYHSIRLVAREALWRRDRLTPQHPQPTHPAPRTNAPDRPWKAGLPDAVVFIQGDNEMPNDFQIDPWRQTYSTSDSGPTYRLGKNLYVLQPVAPDGEVTRLTHFEDGYVADCEVSWDGRRVVFAHRGGDADPWWHIYEVRADGTGRSGASANPNSGSDGLRQITRGPYHDVQPAYLPDGRIVFSSTRIGMRDEYHGYLATGLAVMNPDGSDVHCIGFNVGRDNEPAVLGDGRIVFSRLELFYSRLKTELVVEAAFPDGTKNVSLYGPERRHFWRQITLDSGEGWWGEVPSRHRVLRLTQPQPFDSGRVICATTGGFTLAGPGRFRETILPHDKKLAMTTPFPLADGTVLCAATEKHSKPDPAANATRSDLGLYRMDPATGAMELLYNDPEAADFEPRPLTPRPRPPALAEGAHTRTNQYTAHFFCSSAHVSRDARVRERGKLVRVVEGRPVVARHRTHRALGENAWRNHTGTHARVLGTAPLATDGSFHLEVPADRLLHLQVLDSDRRVVGNQLIWMYARPGETRSCAGCHERPDTAPPMQARAFAAAGRRPPIRCLPTGGEFSYRAKFWNKGELPDEGEERTRTVRAVSLLGRY